jgi:hypothetical protein
MKFIVLFSVIGVLLLQSSIDVPLASVGGSMTIGFAFLAAALAVGVHEAWTKRRGFLGWIVNFVVSFMGAFVIAPLGGAIIAIALSDGSRSLAAAGGPRLTIALVGGMLVSLFGAWGALWIVNRWR